MTATILITGASTGIGNLTARELAKAGHTVYASMLDPGDEHGRQLRTLAEEEGLDLRTVELDVRSEESAGQAVARVIDEVGALDVVVHNAGHLVVGYAEAFTPDDISTLFDVNVLGAQRVNRAALPHMRERHHGTLLYVGSTSVIDVPAFLGPYVASKAAFDVLAQATSYEVAPLGIETVIVMPGPFTRGTSHFPNASRASDTAVTERYGELEPFAARLAEVAGSLYEPGTDPDPVHVAYEIERILALPFGQRPSRSVVDFTRFSIKEINAMMQRHIETTFDAMGYSELLTVRQGG